MKNRVFKILSGCLLIGLYSTELFAFPNILETWRITYPTSSSDDANCQLCHQNSGGGNGWNAYGWSIRGLINDEGETIADAITLSEGSNSDVDPTRASNITETNGNSQPGWTLGANNTIFFKNDTTLANQTPPSLPTEIDPPARILDPIVGGIAKSGSIRLEDVANGFVAPNYATPAPGLAGHLFVVDQVGKLWQVNLSTGAKVEFLDTSADLVNGGALGAFGPGTFDERGLLGVAFHPQYASNGLLYTYQSEPLDGAADFSTIEGGQTANHQTVIAEWQVTNPTSALSVVNNATKRDVLRIDQPQFNHNGGMLSFGPDGFLYISLGDGGGRDDEQTGHGASGNGLDATNPLGAILRIDPTGNTSANGQYAVPGSNPFTAGGDNRLDEIFAYGLRNVFRFSFDSMTGDLIAGDVGQGDIEEVNIIESGKNYGWNAKEGTFFFYPNGIDPGYVSNVMSPNATNDMVDPILQYDHDEGLSVMGGYVYRGTEMPDLVGTYVFGDWSRDFGTPDGRLFFSSDMQTMREFNVSGQNGLGFFLNGFGQDEGGELYIVGNTTGTPSGTTGVLKKLVSSAAGDETCFPIPNGSNNVAVVCL